MGYVIRMPQLGMSMERGTVVEWAVREGEEVEEGETVVVVESEKTTSEVEAREAGVLGRVLVPEGGTVEPGDPIGVLIGPNEDVAEYEANLDVPTEATAGGGGAETGGIEDEGAETRDDASDVEDEDVRATPGARRLAEERDIRLAGIEGTGPQGVITEDDVEGHAGDGAEAPTVNDTEEGTTRRTVLESSPLSSMQRTISERLGGSYREAVHVTLDREFDAGALEAAVSAAREVGVEVSVLDPLIKAAGAALEAHPEFNAVFEDGEHRLIEEQNIGVAVDVERGLVTPVIPEVGKKSTEEVAEARRDLTERVSRNEFTMDDLEGGTFTVSNLGPFGVDSFDPIINPPEIAILGVGREREDGTMTLSLSFDHRVVNGADAARFLDTLVRAATDGETLAGFFDADVAVSGGRAEETREVEVESVAGYSGTYRVADGNIAFDEPTDMGGTGLAPTPIEHLLGALGSCLSLAFRTMAERDEIEVGRIECSVDGHPDSGPLESVDLELSVESDADDRALDQTVTKAERACYVERALSSDIDVTVSWTRA